MLLTHGPVLLSSVYIITSKTANGMNADHCVVCGMRRIELQYHTERDALSKRKRKTFPSIEQWDPEYKRLASRERRMENRAAYVSAIIISRKHDKILLGWKQTESDQQGCWVEPGGKTDCINEDLLCAVIREVSEETGLLHNEISLLDAWMPTKAVGSRDRYYFMFETSMALTKKAFQRVTGHKELEQLQWFDFGGAAFCNFSTQFGNGRCTGNIDRKLLHMGILKYAYKMTH